MKLPTRGSSGHRYRELIPGHQLATPRLPHRLVARHMAEAAVGGITPRGVDNVLRRLPHTRCIHAPRPRPCLDGGPITCGVVTGQLLQFIEGRDLLQDVIGPRQERCAGIQVLHISRIRFESRATHRVLRFHRTHLRGEPSRGAVVASPGSP